MTVLETSRRAGSGSDKSKHEKYTLDQEAL